MHFVYNSMNTFVQHIIFYQNICLVSDLHICITWRRSLRNGSASLAKSGFLRPEIFHLLLLELADKLLTLSHSYLLRQVSILHWDQLNVKQKQIRK